MWVCVLFYFFWCLVEIARVGHGGRVDATVHCCACVREPGQLRVEGRATGPLSGAPAGGHDERGETAMSGPGVHSLRGLQFRGTEDQDTVLGAQGGNAFVKPRQYMFFHLGLPFTASVVVQQ